MQREMRPERNSDVRITQLGATFRGILRINTPKPLGLVRLISYENNANGHVPKDGEGKVYECSFHSACSIQKISSRYEVKIPGGPGGPRLMVLQVDYPILSEAGAMEMGSINSITWVMQELG
ncbi:hypothetical protein KEM60_02986 [Austwickia sp. TVS 96-490-7B]|nr:hypothetical protein [Austwickia sp. TVS 96-490-7B]